MNSTEVLTMDLHNLNIFIQVAELNSFTKAGEKLGYSQPTVSFQIKQLEQQLGIQLFERIGHTVSLTDAGREALAYAQRICHLSDEMTLNAGKKYEPNGIIRLAMANSLCSPMIVRQFADFHRTYPNISLKITTAGTDEMFRLLDHNEADMVCTLDKHIYDTTYIIASEEKIGLHFVCSSRNPLAAIPAPAIEDLLLHPFILTEKGMSYRRLLDERMAQNMIDIHPILELGDADQICRLVEDNVGISFLPDYVTQEAVRRGNLTRLTVRDFHVELWKQLIYHRDKWMARPMQAVLDYLSQIMLT